MLKIKFENLLVILVLSLIVGYDTLMTTMLNRVIPNLPVVLLICFSLLLCFRFIYIKKFTFFYILTAILLLLTSLIVFMHTGGTNFLLYSLLILLLYNAEIDVILRTYVIVSGTIVLVIFLFSNLGVIPNLQFAQIRSSGLVIRNSFGFIYPTDFASHCFYLFIAWGYLLREKFIVLRTLVGISLAFFIIKFCDARLNALSILVATIIFIVMYLTKERKFIIYRILPYFAAIFSLLMFYLSYFFTWSSSLFVSLNNLFSMRLFLGKNAINTYGLHLFGATGVKFIGYGGTTESVYSYNYVDSSYIQMLFYYGVVPVVLLVFIYVLASIKIYKKGKFLFLDLLFFISIIFMFEVFWIRPGYNIFIFTLFASLLPVQYETKNRIELS